MQGPMGVNGTQSRLGRTEAFFVVFLTWVAIYLPALGQPELKGEEGRRVLPAIAMLQTGDWLVPHVGGEAYYGKPPFVNWLVAGAFFLTGERNEQSARLPSVLLILTFVVLLIWLPGGWLSVDARIIGAIAFLTTIGMIDKGRQIEIEAAYVSLTSMAILCWLTLWMRGQSPWALWLVPCVFLVCGILTKGPPILVFHYVPVLCILAYSKRLRMLLSIPHLTAAVLCLGIPASWAYLALHQAPGAYVRAGMFSEMAARLTPASLDWPAWATHVLASFMNLLPWILFVPALWRRDFAAYISSLHWPLFKGARLGLAIAFLSITLIPGNGGRYGLPAVGLGSILLGWTVAAVVELPDRGRLWRRFTLAGYVLAALVATAGFIGLRRDPWAAVVLCGTVSLAVILIRRSTAFRTPASLAILSASLAAVLMLQYSLFAPPLMARAENRRPIAQMVNSLVPEQETIYVFKPSYLDFLFYLREPLAYVTGPGQLDDRTRFVLMHEAAYQQLMDDRTICACPARTLCTFTYRHKGDFRLLEFLRTPRNQETVALHSP